MAKNYIEKLANTRIIAKNTVWNLVGQGIPLIVALFAIPLLVKGLGTDRFGILMLVWTVVGYFGLFDLGLGRALTKLVAEKLGKKQNEDLIGLVWTGLLLMAILGAIGTLVTASISPWLVCDLLTVPKVLQNETLKAFYLLAASLPIVIVSNGLRGILEAYQRFDLINLVRIPLGAFSFLGPLLVLPFTNEISYIVSILLLGRILTCLAFLGLCLHQVPELRHNFRPRMTMVSPLLSFGSWMTVSNIVSPLMTHLDRFFIASFISVGAVGFYTTPYEIVTKLSLIPDTLIRVLFPAFSLTMNNKQERSIKLYGQGINYILVVLFPVVLVIVTFAHQGMLLWLGIDFADKSTFILQWLAVGVYINSIAWVPFAFIQSAGRPDLTAKIHLLELPFYLLSLWLLLQTFGLKGAAIAWVLRVGIDAMVLLVMSRWILSESRIPTGGIYKNMAFFITLLIVGACLPPALYIKCIFLVATMIGFVSYVWFWLLTAEDKAYLKRAYRSQIARNLPREES